MGHGLYYATTNHSSAGCVSESLRFEEHPLMEVASKATWPQPNRNLLGVSAATALFKGLGCFEKEASRPRGDCVYLARGKAFHVYLKLST